MTTTAEARLSPTEAQADFDDALARAFAKIDVAVRAGTSEHGAYSTLADVTDAIRGPLTDEAFSWPQLVALDEQGITVKTQLRRTGLFIESTLSMPLEAKDPHSIGSAITYARRYALSAMCGVAPEDDDGAAAQRSSQPQDEAPGGWRSNAPKALLAWDDEYRELARLRGEFIGKLDAPSDQFPPTPQRILAITGKDFYGDPRIFSAKQREDIIRGFTDDVADLRLLEGEAESEHGKA